MTARRQRIRRFLLALLFLVLPVTLNYYSPYLMTMGTAARIASFSLLFWAAVFVSAFVLGRSFCGWACPFNGLQQLWESVSIRPLKLVRYLPALKYVLWGAWVAAVVGIAVAVGGWERIDLLYLTETGVSVSEAGNLVTYFMLVLLTLLPVLLGRRGFCRYVCPFGVWGIVAEKIGHAAHVPRLLLRAESSACTGCGTCSRACPMQLPVADMVKREQMRTTECFMCETCVDVCPSKAIEVGFGRAK